MSAPDRESPRACPACDAARARAAFCKRGFDHLRCARCGTLFVARVPTPDELAAIYLDPSYHEHAGETEIERRAAEAEARARRLRALGAQHVLEVGCGVGSFLDAAARIGLDVEGVDRAPSAARARARGHRVHDRWLDELRPVAARFDAIAAWEVLEHVASPLAMLEGFRPWLRPGGVLALSTPSFSGVYARALGPRFPMVCPPEHLELFTRRGLVTLLDRGGFELRRLRSFSNLGRARLANGFRRYALGESPLARAAASALAVIAEQPARLVDAVGLGISFEAYARMR